MAMLSGSFGALALLLSAVGLYGVTVYAVNRRRMEIGIRMAIGAAPRRVVRLVLARVTILLGIGLAIGAGASIWTSRFVAALLYGLEPGDPVTLAGIGLVFTAVTICACLIPARRATRLDPLKALRID